MSHGWGLNNIALTCDGKTYDIPNRSDETGCRARSAPGWWSQGSWYRTLKPDNIGSRQLTLDWYSLLGKH